MTVLLESAFFFYTKETTCRTAEIFSRTLRSAVDAGTLVGSRSPSLRTATPGTVQGTPAGRRRVTIGGRRVTVVDVHAHTFVPEVVELVKNTPLAATAKNRLERAHRAGPGHSPRDCSTWTRRASTIRPSTSTRGVIRRNARWRRPDSVTDERIAQAVAAQPDRFVGMATLALQHPDLAADQLDYAVRKLGLRGAAIGGSGRGAGAF